VRSPNTKIVPSHGHDLCVGEEGARELPNPKNTQHMVCFPCPGGDGRAREAAKHENVSMWAHSCVGLQGEGQEGEHPPPEHGEHVTSCVFHVLEGGRQPSMKMCPCGHVPVLGCRGKGKEVPQHERWLLASTGHKKHVSWHVFHVLWVPRAMRGAAGEGWGRMGMMDKEGEPRNTKNTLTRTFFMFWGGGAVVGHQ